MALAFFNSSCNLLARALLFVPVLIVMSVFHHLLEETIFVMQEKLKQTPWLLAVHSGIEEDVML